MAFTVKEIIELMEQAARLGVSVEVTDRDYAVKVDGLWRPSAATPVAPAVPATLPLAAAAPAQEAAPAALQVQTEAQPTKSAGKTVKSPIVGTFYASPSPDQPPFVTAGKAVKKGDVLFIIESMKLMNEVTSEYDGVVREILTASGQAVEYGQPILMLD